MPRHSQHLLLQALLLTLLLLQLLLKLLQLPFEVRNRSLLTLELGLQLADLVRVLINDEILAADTFENLTHLRLVRDPLLAALRLLGLQRVLHLAELLDQVLLLRLDFGLAQLDHLDSLLAQLHLLIQCLVALAQLKTVILLLSELLLQFILLLDDLLHLRLILIQLGFEFAHFILQLHRLLLLSFELLAEDLLCCVATDPHTRVRLAFISRVVTSPIR